MDEINESFSNMSVQDQTNTSAMDQSLNVLYDGPIVKNVIDVIDLVSEPEEPEEKPSKPEKSAAQLRRKTRSMTRKEKGLGLSHDEIFCLPVLEHRQKPKKNKAIPGSGSSTVDCIESRLSDELPDSSLPVLSSTPRRGAGITSAVQGDTFTALQNLPTRTAAAVTTTAASCASRSRVTASKPSTAMSVTTLDSVGDSFTYPSADSIICLDSTGFEDIAATVSSASCAVTTTCNLSVSSSVTSRASISSSAQTTGTRPVAVVNPASTNTVTVPSAVTLPSTDSRAVAANAANLIPAFFASLGSSRFPAVTTTNSSTVTSSTSLSSALIRPVSTYSTTQSSSIVPYITKPTPGSQARTHQNLWKSHGSIRDSHQQASLCKRSENTGLRATTGGIRKDYWRNVDVIGKSQDAVDSRYKQSEITNRYGAGNYYNRNIHRVVQSQAQNQGYRFDNYTRFTNQAICFTSSLTSQQPVFTARAKNPLDDLQLENVEMMIFVDLDNIRSFFKRLDSQLPPFVFVYGFHGGKYAWYEPVNCPIFQDLKWKGMFKLHERCSFRKDAADFAICTAAGALNVKLPSKIPFIIVSGDQGFLEVERISQSWSRHVLVLNPHRCARMSMTFIQIWRKYASNCN